MRERARPRITGSAPMCAAQHVDDRRLRVGAQDRTEHERRLRRLLHRAKVPHEPVTADGLEHPAELLRRLILGRSDKPRDRGLPGLQLPEIHQPGDAPDRPGEERRPGSRSAEHEHGPLGNGVEILTPMSVSPRQDARDRTRVEACVGRFGRPGHRVGA